MRAYLAAHSGDARQGMPYLPGTCKTEAPYLAYTKISHVCTSLLPGVMMNRHLLFPPIATISSHAARQGGVRAQAARHVDPPLAR